VRDVPHHFRTAFAEQAHTYDPKASDLHYRHERNRHEVQQKSSGCHSGKGTRRDREQRELGAHRCREHGDQRDQESTKY
jgi:hypothetical protein